MVLQCCIHDLCLIDQCTQNTCEAYLTWSMKTPGLCVILVLPNPGLYVILVLLLTRLVYNVVSWSFQNGCNRTNTVAFSLTLFYNNHRVECDLSEVRSHPCSLTWAENPCIAVFTAILMAPPRPVAAVLQCRLLSITFNLVKPNMLRYLSGRTLCRKSSPTAKLFADHFRILALPGLTSTNGTPLTIMKNFNSSSTPMSPIHEPNVG